MKVLHVIARFNVGGTATYLYNLLNGLKVNSIETILVTGLVPENEKEDSRIVKLKYARVKNLSRALSPINDVLAYRQINSVIRDFKPDIIHCHTFKAGLLMRFKKQPIPIIHTFHGHHLYDPEFGWLARLMLNSVEKVLAKKSWKLITIGEIVKKELLNKKIGKKGQYVSIAPGIEKPKSINSVLVREKFAIKPGDFVVVWLGRFTKVKRPDIVLEVAKRLPKVVFLMAGDGELREKMESVSPTNLRILGVQEASEMWGIANLALLTSDSEGMPLTLIEAQMSGIPVVATNVGSVSEIVEDGVTGVLTLVDVDQISSSLEELVANPSKLEKMGKAAELRASGLFSQEVMVERHIRVYQEVLGKVSQ